MHRKSAIVLHSGGMDSSICLAVAIQEHGAEAVLSLGARYGQRHSVECAQATKICADWGVDRVELNIDCLQLITDNALINSAHEIVKPVAGPPTTLVVGRNGLLVRLAAIHADSLGAKQVYTGVIEVESANSGYRDCSRVYMDLLQTILRMDLADETFEIKTPVVKLTKCETMELAHKLGVLEYLLQETITCYRGVPQLGCQSCPACELRNAGIREFAQKYPAVKLPYQIG